MTTTHPQDYPTTWDTTDDSRLMSIISRSYTGRKVSSLSSLLEDHARRHRNCLWKGWKRRDFLSQKLLDAQREHYRYVRDLCCSKHEISASQATSLSRQYLTNSQRIDGSHNADQHLQAMITLLLQQTL